MEQAETKQGQIFEIYDVPPKFHWPDDAPGQCVAKSCGGNKVDIVRGPHCTEQDLAEMMERCENDWKERHGIEVPAGGLTFDLR